MSQIYTSGGARGRWPQGEGGRGLGLRRGLRRGLREGGARALITAITLSALSGCWGEPTGACEEGACGGEEGVELLPAAHSPRCLDTDGPLCLLSAEIDDADPRHGALTPGERLALRAVTLVNAQPYPLTLSALSARAQTTELLLEEAGVTLLGARGEPAPSPLEGGEGAGGEGAGGEGGGGLCAEGVLPAFGACRFTLSVAFKLSEDAPINAEQSAVVSVRYEARGGGVAEEGEGGAALSVPLLVVDPAAGLRVTALRFDDSTRDGLLQPGDRLRVRELRLENNSLAPFEDLTAHLSPDGAAIRLGEGARAVMWEGEEGAVSGLASTALTTCPAARLEREGDEERLVPGECSIALTGDLEVSAEAPVGADARVSLRFKAGEERVGAAEEISFEVRPLEVALSLDSLALTADEDGDGAVAPGERVTFGVARVLNLSGTAVSLRGRVSSQSPLVEVLSGSDLSVEVEGDGFYEGCGGEGFEAALCEAPIRLRAQISPEAREGDELEFSAELIDQSGARHELSWSARVTRPRVALELEELTVTQDTLDPRLSGGERGLVSYVKLINTGDADALGLRGSLRAESPYLTPTGEGATAEGAEWPVELKEMSARVSSGADPMSGDCLAVDRSEGAYCYARLNLPFTLSDEAPVGAVISFWLDLEDDLGQRYSLPYEMTLY